VGLVERNKAATLGPLALSQQNAGLLAKDGGSVDGSHISDTMSQVPLEFMDVILTFSSTPGMLTVDRIHSKSPWADT